MKKIIVSMSFLLVATGTFLANITANQVASQNLFAATANGKQQEVKKILSKGVDINALNAQGKTALDVAVERNHFKVARELVYRGAKVTTEKNAFLLKRKFEKRGRNFFIAGWFFTPLLWIGTFTSFSHASDVLILNK